MAETEQETLLDQPIGMRLKAAREAHGLSLDDVAAKTRVPIRHLQHIEKEEWDALPAPTYSVGFARAYASAVGLNGSEIGSQLRAQLGAGPLTATPQYEPADPARVPPKALAITAIIIALLLVGGYLIWRSKAVDSGIDESQIAGLTPDANEQAAAPPAPVTAPAATPAPQAPITGPVVLTATSDVWLRIYDGKGGPKLREGTLKAGDRYEVPATATHPLILTGRPDGLKVTVGSREIPALGAANKTIADVSLLPADLLARASGAGAAAAAPSGAPAGQAGGAARGTPQRP